MRPDVQRIDALARANQVRFGRAHDKKAIKHGRMDACRLLHQVPGHWHTASVLELLLAIDHVGDSAAQHWCAMEHITPTRRLGELTARQRAALATRIDTWTRRRGYVPAEPDRAAA